MLPSDRWLGHKPWLVLGIKLPRGGQAIADNGRWMRIDKTFLDLQELIAISVHDFAAIFSSFEFWLNWSAPREKFFWRNSLTESMFSWWGQQYGQKVSLIVFLFFRQNFPHRIRVSLRKTLIDHFSQIYEQSLLAILLHHETQETTWVTFVAKF